MIDTHAEDRAGWRRISGGLCVMCFGIVLVSCGDGRFMLRPLPEVPSAVETGTGVRVTVDPVSTSPELNPDEIDLLARFYSALWVEVRNGTASPVIIEPGGVMIFDQTGTPWVALDRTQRKQVLRWRSWSYRSWFARWFLAGRLNQLTAKLDRLQLEAGALTAGEAQHGLLLFKPIPASVCRRMTMEWQAAGTGNRETLSAATPPGRPMVHMALGCSL